MKSQLYSCKLKQKRLQESSFRISPLVYMKLVDTSTIKIAVIVN